MKYRHWIIIPAIAIVVFEKMTGMSWLQPAGNAAILLWCAYSLHALNKLEWLGNYSYGMYLYHCPILMVMMSLGIFRTWNVWIASGVFIGMVLVASALSWHLMVHKLFAGLGLIEDAGEIRCHGHGVLFLDTSHLHAEVFGFDNDHDTKRV